MYIRTKTNIYEVNNEGIIFDTESHTPVGFYVSDTDVIRDEQVIKRTVTDVEDLADCFALFVDGNLIMTNHDLLTVESYAIKYPHESVQIFGIIIGIDRFGEIKSKVVIEHAVDENGYGYYKLIK